MKRSWEPEALRARYFVTEPRLAVRVEASRIASVDPIAREHG
jgi:hypothetical protein